MTKRPLESSGGDQVASHNNCLLQAPSLKLSEFGFLLFDWSVVLILRLSLDKFWFNSTLLPVSFSQEGCLMTLEDYEDY